MSHSAYAQPLQNQASYSDLKVARASTKRNDEREDYNKQSEPD